MENLSGVVKASFSLSRRTTSAKKMFLCNLSFKNFGETERKLFGHLATKNSRNLIKTFLASWGVFSRDCFLIKKTLLLSFSDVERTFVGSRWKFSGNFSKLFPTCQENRFKVNKSFWKKFYNVLHISIEKNRTSGRKISAKFFNLQSTCRDEQLGKNIFYHKKTTHYQFVKIFGCWVRKNRIFRKKVAATRQNGI